MRRIIFEALGLSDKEHSVLNVLQHQSLAQKISKISFQTKLPQTTTAFILRKLEKRKLAIRKRHNNHFVWGYRKSIDLFETITENSTKNSFISVVSGIRNIELELRKILDLGSSERLLSIQGAGISKNILKKIDEKFMHTFHDEIRKRRIIVEGVVAESVYNLFEKMTTPQLFSHLDRLTIVYVLPDELINFPLNIFIFGNRIILVDYETERLVRIEDPALQESYKALFFLAEQFGRKINLNKYIRELIVKRN